MTERINTIMSFSIGIVGLPNVGKSTLFKALTNKQVNISNYPFCTIDPNVGCVSVPDKRLDELTKVLKPQKVLPTTIEFVDIAGLVKGAHKGEGLGNKFLAHIREVDAILHLVRDFAKENITHVSGKIDAEDDKQTVNLELIFADLETIKKHSEKLTKLVHGQDKEAAKKLEVLNKIKADLEQEKLVSEINLSDDEKELLEDVNLLTIKPVIYVINVSENDLQKSYPDFVTISAQIESELSELADGDKKEFLDDLKLSESGLNQLIKKSYEVLNLVTFFTFQNGILQAWTVEKDTLVPKAGGKIHGDFEKGFIKAEIINWEDLVEVGNEQVARDKGLIKTEGKNYVVQDGDVIHFRFAK